MERNVCNVLDSSDMAADLSMVDMAYSIICDTTSESSTLVVVFEESVKREKKREDERCERVLFKKETRINIGFRPGLTR